MYAHKVIEEIEGLLKHIQLYGRPPGEKFTRFIAQLKESKKLINSSHSFHFGSLEDITNTNREGLRLFSDFAEQIRLPFKTCWFEYTGKGDDQKEQKFGLIVEEKKPNLLHILEWSMIPAHGGKWLLSPFGYLINVQKDAPPGNIGIVDLYADLDFKEYNEYPNNINTEGILTGIYCSLLLLSCKNIELVRNIPPIKLNNKRIRKGKTPLFSYYTLKLKLPQTKSKTKSNNLSQYHNRIHFCRGHFKEYKKDSPLFGKYTGLYWWQPHVRGQNHDGIVMKDYEIDPKRED